VRWLWSWTPADLSLAKTTGAPRRWRHAWRASSSRQLASPCWLATTPAGKCRATSGHRARRPPATCGVSWSTKFPKALLTSPSRSRADSRRSAARVVPRTSSTLVMARPRQAPPVPPPSSAPCAPPCHPAGASPASASGPNQTPNRCSRWHFPDRPRSARPDRGRQRAHRHGEAQRPRAQG
jgi:hypothetical protein